MKSKLSWIAFMPFAAGAVFFKLAQEILPDGAILGLSDLILTYVSIGCVAVVLLLTLLFCLIDKEIGRYYLLHRNFGAGIIGILLAIVLAADGALRIFTLLGGAKIEPMNIADIVLSILSAMVFVILGLSHFMKRGTNKKLALLYLMPAFWAAIRLVRNFIDFTTISVKMADVSLLIALVLSTMFLFNYAVLLSVTKAKNAPKSCIIYGMPAAAALLAYGVYAMYTSFSLTEILDSAMIVEALLLAVYILAFMVELTVFVKRRSMQTIIGEGEDEEEYKDVDDDEDKENRDNMVFISDATDNDRDSDDSAYFKSTDTSDYIYRETPISDELNKDLDAIEPGEDDLKGYVMKRTRESDVPKENGDYTSRMDEIDKLILEISDEELK